MSAQPITTADDSGLDFAVRNGYSSAPSSLVSRVPDHIEWAFRTVRPSPWLEDVHPRLRAGTLERLKRLEGANTQIVDPVAASDLNRVARECPVDWVASPREADPLYIYRRGMAVRPPELTLLTWEKGGRLLLAALVRAEDRRGMVRVLTVRGPVDQDSDRPVEFAAALQALASFWYSQGRSGLTVGSVPNVFPAGGALRDCALRLDVGLRPVPIRPSGPGSAPPTIRGAIGAGPTFRFEPCSARPIVRGHLGPPLCGVSRLATDATPLLLGRSFMTDCHSASRRLSKGSLRRDR